MELTGGGGEEGSEACSEVKGTLRHSAGLSSVPGGNLQHDSCHPAAPCWPLWSYTR